MGRDFDNACIIQVVVNTALYGLRFRLLEQKYGSIRTIAVRGIGSRLMMMYVMRLLIVDVDHFAA